MSLRPERLKRYPLFSSLPARPLADVAAFSELLKVSKGAMLFYQGDPATAFYMLEYGRVKIYRSSPEGREQILHMAESGQTFAEAAVLSMPNYPAHASAMEESLLIKVPRVPFERLISEHSNVARALLAGQAMWLRRLVDLNASLSLESVASRLARYLISTAENAGLEVTDGVAMPLETKKNTIAAQLGTVPETLSRNFSKLERSGLLRREGKTVMLLDAEKLIDLAYSDVGA